MKYDVFSAEIDNPKTAIYELGNLFKLKSSDIVDGNGVTLINLGWHYFYRHDEILYPVVDNVSHRGDYYDSSGKLACTHAQKVIALRESAHNRKVVMSYVTYNGQLDSVMEIIAYFVMDYYCTIRAFETSDLYSNTITRLRPEFETLVRTNPDEMDELIARMIRLVDVTFPGLISAISDLAAEEDTAYSVLEIVYDGCILHAMVIDDWRILEWKRLTVNGKAMKPQLRDRDVRREETDIINKAIERMSGKKADKPVKLPASRLITNFRNL